MKDIEQLLAASDSPKPRRALRADFTRQITNHIADHPKQKMIHPKELFMKLLTKPALTVAALVGTIVIGGSAYAAVNNWPAISAFFAGETDTPNGRIVKIDTENCIFPNAFNITSDDKNQGAYYYKVKNDSKLTNEQVVEIVKGNCVTAAQIEFDRNVIQQELNSNPLNKDRLISHYIDSVVTAISPTSITLESVFPEGNELKTFKETFNHIDSAVIVFNGPHRLDLGQIKVGDHVSIMYRPIAEGNDMTPYANLGPGTINTDSVVVAAIFKLSPDMVAAANYQKYNGTEFEQVIPCDHGGHDGFCTVAEYYQNK